MNWDNTPCADWREDQQLLSLRGICHHRRCRPHPQDDCRSSRESSPERSDSSLIDSLLRGLNELLDWEVLTSKGIEVRVVLLKDFRPRSYEGMSEAWKKKQEDSCYLVMAWYWRSRIFGGKGEEIRQWNAKQIHPDNDVYRDANYAKQKHKRMSACLQLIRMEMKTILHWVPDVGWLSACRLMSACSSVDDFSRYPNLASKTPID